VSDRRKVSCPICSGTEFVYSDVSGWLLCADEKCGGEILVIKGREKKLNDRHDNAATDKEMLERHGGGGVVSETSPFTRGSGLNDRYEGAKQPNPIHTDPNVQFIDIRIYFNNDIDVEGTLDDISRMLQDSEMMCDMISAYQLRNDGFSHLTPDDKPLA